MLSSEPVAASASPCADDITRALEQYLGQHPACVVLEAGRVLFAMDGAQYTVQGSGACCTLHLWSESANAVRRVTAAAAKGDALRLTVTRLGQRRPQTWELRPGRSVRAATGREQRRRDALRQIERVLRREFPNERVAGFRSAMDLEHSFGPAYLRGEMMRGREGCAVVAVGAGESQATIDGALSLSLLWLEHCRERTAGRQHISRVRVILPEGAAGTTASRLRWLRTDAVRLELYTLSARDETLSRVDPLDAGNTVTQLVRAGDELAIRARFAESIAAVLRLLPVKCTVTGVVTNQMREGDCDASSISDQPTCKGTAGRQHGAQALIAPQRGSSGKAHRNQNLAAPASPVCEVQLRSSAEVAFLCHGFPFARIRPGFAQGSFRRQDEITVGAGAAETLLTSENEEEMRTLVAELFRRRRPGSSLASDTLARTQPERWLESALRCDLAALDPELAPAPVYTQLPAFTGEGASLDRGLLDLLAVTRSGRLVIVEIKTHEDLDLAMQGLDYWIRVREHHLTRVDPATGLGSLQQHGYFPQTRLTPEAPRLFLVAPALHIHPATETILRYVAPEVDWTLIALDERWRTRIRPVWVRRSERSRAVSQPEQLLGHAL